MRTFSPALLQRPGGGSWSELIPSWDGNSPMVMVPLNPQASLDEVARILRLVAEMPGRRDRPRPGDLDGPYDVWFDGGGCRYLTSLNAFNFADGSSAWLSTLSLRLKGGLTLASGETISFAQDPPREDICAVCRGALTPGGTFKQTLMGPAHVGCG